MHALSNSHYRSREHPKSYVFFIYIKKPKPKHIILNKRYKIYLNQWPTTKSQIKITNKWNRRYRTFAHAIKWIRHYALWSVTQSTLLSSHKKCHHAYMTQARMDPRFAHASKAKAENESKVEDKAHFIVVKSFKIFFLWIDSGSSFFLMT